MTKKPEVPKALIGDVDDHLRAFSPLRLGPLTDKQRLERDLGLYGYQRKALGGPFQRIAEDRRREPAITPKISRVACGKLKTVKAARALVSKEAGYTYSGETAS